MIPRRPGWYRAPSGAVDVVTGRPLVRAWDGTRWTRHVALDHDQPAWPPLGLVVDPPTAPVRPVPVTALLRLTG